MNARHRLLIVGLSGAMFGASRVGAQSGGALVLRLPASTRALAMGNAFVAGRGSEVLFYNPALLALQAGMSAAAQRDRSTGNSGTVSAALASGPWGAGLGVQVLNDYVIYSRFAPGQALAASSLAAVLGGAAQFKGVRVGAAAKYVEERTPLAPDHTIVADLGAARDIGPVTAGLSVQNLGGGLGPSGAHAPMPWRATLGAAFGGYPLGAYFDLAATAAVSVLRGGDVMPAGGVELTYVPLEGWGFSLRAGARRTEFRSQQPLTLGAGVSLDRVSLDYAYASLDGPGGAHRVGLRIR